MSNRLRERLRMAVAGALLLAAVLLAAPTGAVAGDVAPLGKLTPVQREARIELGRRLFFEPDASLSGQRDCASCHDPNHGFSDPKRLSADDFGITTRHSQTIIDGARNPSAHWDGEFRTVEQLVTKRVGSSTSPWQPRGGRQPPDLPPLALKADGRVHVSATLVRFLRSRLPSKARNFPSRVVPDRMQAHGRYDEAFRAAFGSDSVTVERIAKAVEAYCRTVKSTEAPIDRYLRGDTAAIPPAARRGFALFRGRAGCIECHKMEGPRPAFSDYTFHNTGISWSGVLARYAPKQVELLGRVLKQEPSVQVAGIRGVAGPIQLLADGGRGARVRTAGLNRHFKTPTLRDVARRPPYMHDGRLKTLSDVVRYYARGCCKDDPRLDEKLKGFEASDQDVADLVAFLESLSGDVRPGLAKSAWRARAKTTRVRVLNAYGRPLTDAVVFVTPAGDTLPIDDEGLNDTRKFRTDADGAVEFEPAAATHARIKLAHYGTPEGEVMIPDTCKQVRLEIPVAGVIRFVATFRQDQQVPDHLVFHAVYRRGVKFKLVRTELVETPDGRREASYEGLLKRRLPTEAELHMDELDAVVTMHLRPGLTVRLDMSRYGVR